MSDRQRVTAALGLAFFFYFAPDGASAYCRMTTRGGAQVGNAACVENGAPLVWNNPCLSYAVDARGSRWFQNADGTPDLAQLEALVDESFAAWPSADCGGSRPNLIFKPLQPSTCQRAEFNTTGNVNTIAFLDPWKDPCAGADDSGYDPLAFAVTVVWHNTTTGEILDADMMLNDKMATRFNAGGPYADCPEEGCPAGGVGSLGPADLRSIITHEAGHFIGIGHSDVPDATMFASNARDSVDKRTLSPDDINAVCDIYPPGNLDSSCNAAPMGGLLLNCETTDSGSPIACDDPAVAPTNGGGCNACRIAAGSDRDTWALFLAALVGFIAMRRRPARCGARS